MTIGIVICFEDRLYYKYNDKLNLLWYYVDNKERESGSESRSTERKKT
jgi:hypothetical protein